MRCLLFRMGDFYELFHDDAKKAAQVLNLTLTSREKGENAVPMAGFPYHQLESYLGKLIAAGLRVAICDQVEDPKQAKGLVQARTDADRLPRHRHRRRPARPAREQFPGRARAGQAGRAGVGRAFDRPLSSHAATQPNGWPTSWRASRRSNACWPKTPSRRRTLLDRRHG